MITVAPYVRVSTDNQLDNYSIEEQTERLKAYCTAKGYQIYQFYTDGGFSGGNTNRPALQKMLHDLRQGRFNAVIVYKLDRLSRSQKDTLTLIEDEFLANQVDFISVSENFDTTTPFGKAMIGILSVFAQLEKDQITERFTMGRIGRSKAGYFHGGGNAPKGYTYSDGELVINPVEAEQVREVFQLFLSGKSINAVAKLMEEKYHNGLWDNSSKIYNCIRNSVYIGMVKFKDEEYQGRHEPIISKEDFALANELLHSPERENAKSSAQKTPFRANYLLSSLIYCKRCGARYSANHGYYKCYSRSKSSAQFVTDPDCKNDNWLIPDLDKLVIEEISHIAVDGSYKKLLHKKEKADISELQKEVQKTEKAISRMIDLYQITEIPISQVKEKIEALQDKKSQLLAMIEKAQSRDMSEAFVAAMENFISVMETGGLEEQRLMISTIVRAIYIDGRSVELKWRI